MRSIHDILQQYWGYQSFRPMQEEVIQSVLDGKDTLALMPTGGGKSICYQVPAMLNAGLCLVVSPLIALMKDQVENLRKKDITAFAVYSGMTRKEVINIFKTATESNCKFLYVSPERLETTLFKEYLPGFGINLIAVDEAHCISQWGYDFRPPYLRIAEIRKELSGVPVMALSASATPEVQIDICDKLGFTKQHILRQSFERPNLSYSVFSVDSKINKIIEVLHKVNGSSLVYCRSRKRAKEISELLRLQKISADYYHAGLSTEERNKKQEDWIKNRIRVIVCTNAFGMGIDKPDVRTVIHADVPDCLENYYQEAGRAGRDGKISYAVLLCNTRDLFELEKTTELRYPSIDEIRNVYQAIANYLQLPAGSGGGEYFEFDISDFLKKFNLSSHTVVYALKALEQDSWLSFNEQVFVPASVVFTTNKEYLHAFEKENPQLELLVKTLLRTYGGIFDTSCSISEKLLAGIMHLPAEKIKEDLKRLHKAGIIEYQPQKDTPQLYFLRNRIKTEDLNIDMQAHAKRKESFLKRIRQMKTYATEEGQCRSRIISSYFGDSQTRACGICDNCLRQKASHLSKEEFETLHHRIINLVKYETLDAKDLLLKLNGIKKEKAWKVIEFLQAEDKIEMDKKGLIRLK